MSDPADPRHYPPIPHLTVRAETWRLRRAFTISRGAKAEAQVVVAEVREGDLVGRGECVPYARYGETVDQVVADLDAMEDEVVRGLVREALQVSMPAGAARNALDCALWDLEAKRDRARAWELTDDEDYPEPQPALCAETIVLDAPDAMGAAAAMLADRPLLKVKLDAELVLERVGAVADAAPHSRLIVDANEAWTLQQLNAVAPALESFGVEMIEQPLPRADDMALGGYTGSLMLCADESCHATDTLAGLEGRFGMINIKLDKTGGLTEALHLVRAARDRGFKIMVGCMVGTSLAMAPAMMLESFAEYMDLDGPLMLAKDREPGLKFAGGLVYPPAPEVWG